MINIEALDKLIAVVVVILALSLFVQSLQALLKKMFKIKSLQIETSLVHLFHYMLDRDAGGVISSRLNNSPILRMMTPRSKHPSEKDSLVRGLYEVVVDEFRKVGRVTTTGKLMLDSISKGDLKKFIGRIPSGELIEKLVPGYSEKLAAIETEIVTLEATIKEIKSNYAAVFSSAKVQFDEIEQLVAPLIADARKIFTGETIKADAVIAHIVKFQEIKPDNVRAAQAQVEQAIEKLKPFADAQAAITALQAVNNVLEHLDTVVTGISSIKNLAGKLETWFDTVMQGFEERYTRSMKTWTWIISALVVIFLNANLINIYRDISTSDAKRALVLQAADKIQESARQQTTQEQSDAEITPEQWIKDAKKIIDENMDAYTGMGFKGPSWINEVGYWWRGEASYNVAPRNGWRFGLKEAGKTFLGWFVMILLLSAGAPFWQDTLESLFGIKNLLRKNSETKNVEMKSGAGQPRP